MNKGTSAMQARKQENKQASKNMQLQLTITGVGLDQAHPNNKLQVQYGDHKEISTIHTMYIIYYMYAISLY